MRQGRLGGMSFFPRDYEDAVQRFRAATAGLGGESGNWNVGAGLDVDHVYWPSTGTGECLYILLSGVHGPETYTGHAIQMMFLSELHKKVKRDKCGMLVVHSLNPFGFKTHQRCTEAGVNLNRNCSAGPDLYRVANPGAVDLYQKFVPREPVASPQSFLIESMRHEDSKIWFDDVTLDDFIKTVAMGQYVSPQGFEFGGYGPEPQIVALTALLKKIMPGYRDVVFLDLHTGLGHRGRLHLLSGDKKGCVHPELFEKILSPAADQAIYEYTPNHEEGFYPTYGATNDLMAELAGPGQRMCALTMEFGTLGHDLTSQLHSLNLWLIEHQGTFYGYATPEIEKRVKAEHLEKFCPSGSDWRDTVVDASRQLFTRILERSGHI